MNGATVASGAKHHLPLGVIAQNLTAAAAEVKAGRRNATGDQALIDLIHQAAVDLGCSNCMYPVDEEKSSTEMDEQKGAAEAEVVMPDASLLDISNELNQLELETF